jgi:hypothetical protein
LCDRLACDRVCEWSSNHSTFYLKQTSLIIDLPWLWMIRSTTAIPGGLLFHWVIVPSLGLFFLNLFDRVVALDIRSFFFFFQQCRPDWVYSKKKWAQSMVWPFKIVNTSVSHSISKKWDNPRVKRFLAPFPLVFLPELIQVLKRNNKNQMKIVCFFSLKDALKEIVSESCKYVHHSLTTPRWNNFHQTDCGHLALYLCDIRELHKNMREQRNRKSFSLNIPPSYMEHKWGQDVSRLYSCRVEKLETTGKDDQEGHRKE